MGRGSRHKDASKDLSNAGTSARTRPMSVEDILLRRKKKLEGASKGSASQVKDSLDKNSYREISEFSLHHESDKKLKTPKDAVKDRLGMAEENVSRGAKDKSERKEKGLYEKLKTYNKGSIDKESFKEKQSYRREVDYHLGPDFKDETDNKYLKVANERNKHDVRDHMYRMAGKRKYHSHVDENYRSKVDGAVLKKPDSGKSREKQYPERLDKKAGHFRAYHEEVRSRRRSRSHDIDHEKDRRSFSLSPRSQKHYHHARDYEERCQSYRDKVRRKHSDTNKHRNTGNDYTNEHNVEHGSGLGGYSPRKRKTEHSSETPSPAAHRSPERKIATWDQPPGKTNANLDSVPTEYQLPSAKMDDLLPPVLLTDATTKLHPTPIDIASVVMKTSIDSVQLTEATRRMRRLYVENLPSSTLDRMVIDCLNDFLLSSGVNHIQGTKPCISCIMNMDKCQALVEFLTPEDATAALSFDGRSFSGSILKIRRPKDFVEIPTGALEKLVDDIKGICDVVEDSPHKIFIAGISEAISSDMLMKIAGAFGVLKAYHFEFNEELDGSCAFLEYMDHSITSRACVGLNGMKLGGCFLTAVLAVLETDAVEEETEGVVPSYKIPFYVKPLLVDATQVLELKNVFVEEEFLSISELELDEILDDIRLECARFGSIKSMNMVKYKSLVDKALLQVHDPDVPTKEEEETTEEEAHAEIPLSGSVESRQGGRESSEEGGVRKDLGEGSLKDTDDSHGNNSLESFEKKAAASSIMLMNEEDIPDDGYKLVQPNSDPEAADYDRDNSFLSPTSKMEEMGDKSIDIDISNISCGAADSGEANGEHNKSRIIVDNTQHGYAEGEQSCCDIKYDSFQPGCVLVEYMRREAACIAAHSLHGRSYGDRVVIAGYVQLDAYLRRFPR